MSIIQINFQTINKDLYLILSVQRPFSSVWNEPEIGLTKLLKERKFRKEKPKDNRRFSLRDIFDILDGRNERRCEDRIVRYNNDKPYQHSFYIGSLDEIFEVERFCIGQGIGLQAGIPEDLWSYFQLS